MRQSKNFQLFENRERTDREALVNGVHFSLLNTLQNLSLAFLHVLKLTIKQFGPSYTYNTLNN